MGPKMRNCCKPVQVGTKQHGKMLRRIQTLGDGRVPAKEARIWKLEREEGRLLGRNAEDCRMNEFEMGGFMAQTGLWNLAREKRLQDRGALPGEEGDVNREYSVLHEENFLSSWLRKDVEGKEEGKKRWTGRPKKR